jgi:hypothetical protein
LATRPEEPHHAIPRLAAVPAAERLRHPDDFVPVYQQGLGLGVTSHPGQDLA